MDQNNVVIENIWKKKVLLENGDPQQKTIRPLLLILGGGNLGVYSAGACYALQMLGLGNVFDTVIGISTGAWVSAYYLAGKEQIKIGTSIYYKDFASSEYISLKTFPRPMNASIIENVTYCGHKKLNIEAVQTSPSNFFVGVTDMNGVGHFLDAKKATPSFLSAMYASSAIPLAYKSPKRVNGSLYLDGGIGLAFPIQKVIAEFLPTDVLVLPNCPQDQKHAITFYERVLVKFFFAHLPKAVRAKMLLRHEDFCAGVEFSKNTLNNVHIHWSPDMGIHALSRDSQKLRKAARSSTSQTLLVFSKPNLGFELY
ncbi:MAG: patatin-like phospholipase family protein [Patescibacteria group bacterium]